MNLFFMGHRYSFFTILRISFGGLLLLCFWACPSANGPNQKMPRSAFDYLEDHAMGIDVNTPINLATLKSMLSEHKFIMTGETHGVAANYDLELMMLQYLVEEDWLDYYVPELPLSFCYFLSQYLENGDEEILTRLFAPLKNTFSWTKEAKQHWQKVRVLYQSLPVAKRFRLIGIDVEHQARNAQWMMLDLLPAQDPPSFFSSAVTTLTQLVEINNDDYPKLYELALEIQALMLNQSPALETYLGDHFESFQAVNQLVIHTFEARNDDIFSTQREALIFENVLHYRDLFENGNSFGQWGANHVYQKAVEEISWLAAKMNNDANSPLQGSIYSMLYVYHDCKALLKDPYREANFSNLLFIRDFGKIASGDFTLFQLDLSNSPFEQDLIWPSNSVYLKDGVTTDYVQSIVLVRHSKATTPLD